jgi:hypothetical protein
MALRKTVARWFIDRLLYTAFLAYPQPRGSCSASWLPQTRIRTAYASFCYLTDGLGRDLCLPKTPSDLKIQRFRPFRESMVATTMSSLFVALFRAALQAEILALRHQLRRERK